MTEYLTTSANKTQFTKFVNEHKNDDIPTLMSVLRENEKLSRPIKSQSLMRWLNENTEVELSKPANQRMAILDHLEKELRKARKESKKLPSEKPTQKAAPTVKTIPKTPESILLKALQGEAAAVAGGISIAAFTALLSYLRSTKDESGLYDLKVINDDVDALSKNTNALINFSKIQLQKASNKLGISRGLGKFKDYIFGTADSLDDESQWEIVATPDTIKALANLQLLKEGIEEEKEKIQDQLIDEDRMQGIVEFSSKLRQWKAAEEDVNTAQNVIRKLYNPSESDRVHRSRNLDKKEESEVMDIVIGEEVDFRKPVPKGKEPRKKRIVSGIKKDKTISSKQLREKRAKEKETQEKMDIIDKAEEKKAAEKKLQEEKKAAEKKLQEEKKAAEKKLQEEKKAAEQKAKEELEKIKIEVAKNKQEQKKKELALEQELEKTKSDLKVVKMVTQQKEIELELEARREVLKQLVEKRNSNTQQIKAPKVKGINKSALKRENQTIRKEIQEKKEEIQTLRKRKREADQEERKVKRRKIIAEKK